MYVNPSGQIVSLGAICKTGPVYNLYLPQCLSAQIKIMIFFTGEKFLETGGDIDFEVKNLPKLEKGLFIRLHYLSGSKLIDLFLEVIIIMTLKSIIHTQILPYNTKGYYGGSLL